MSRKRKKTIAVTTLIVAAFVLSLAGYMQATSARGNGVQSAGAAGDGTGTELRRYRLNHQVAHSGGMTGGWYPVASDASTPFDDEYESDEDGQDGLDAQSGEPGAAFGSGNSAAGDEPIASGPQTAGGSGGNTADNAYDGPPLTVLLARGSMGANGRGSFGGGGGGSNSGDGNNGGSNESLAGSDGQGGSNEPPADETPVAPSTSSEDHDTSGNEDRDGDTGNDGLGSGDPGNDGPGTNEGEQPPGDEPQDEAGPTGDEPNGNDPWQPLDPPQNPPFDDGVPQNESPPVQVPEPGLLMLMGMGLAALGLRRRRGS